MKLPVIAALLAVVILGGLGVGWYLNADRSGDQFAQCSSSTAVGGAIGGPFTLVDETGETVTDADVLSEPSLVYFGYTFCPDVCPLDNARNADAIALLDERDVKVQPVFISIDPGRDTAEVVRDYTDLFHPRMLGLTGSQEQVRAASQAYKTFYQIGDTSDPYYLVNHTTFSYLMLPDHGFVELFRREDTAEEMADDIACYVNAM